MVRPYNTPEARCTRCEVNARVASQRWCRACLSDYQRQRRARQAPERVIPAALQAMPHVTQGHAPGLSEPQRQALEAYQHAVHAWQSRQQTRRQGWMPQDRTSMMVQVAQRLEQARQRLLALGMNPEGLRGE
jgi:hypothetical protein